MTAWEEAATSDGLPQKPGWPSLQRALQVHAASVPAVPKRVRHQMQLRNLGQPNGGDLHQLLTASRWNRVGMLE